MKSKTLEDADDLAFVGIAILRLKFRHQTVVGVQPRVQFGSGECFQFMFNIADLFFQINDICFCSLHFFINRIAAA